MRYYKQTNDDYIVAIGIGLGGEEITQTEYENIISVIQLRPQETNSIGYKLKTDLTWEEYEVEELEVPEEIDDSEALDIILGDE